MTVTVEFAPSGPVTATRPRPVRRAAAPARPASVRSRVVSGAPSCVTSRHAPQPFAASSAVQLTRRGWTVLVSLSLAVVAALVLVAFLSHPAAAPAASGPAPSQVVVQAGDTLWSIAGRVAPDRDPRAVVYDLQQANHLDSATVVEGQVLRVG